MSTAQRLTADEYDEMVAQGVFEPAERRIELIRGRLREMSPAGPVHDELVNWLTDWSYSIVGDAPIRIRTQSGLRLNQQESRPEPDIFWVNHRRYMNSHPGADDTLLTIEVSDTSLQYDVTHKSPLYAEARIQECWIINIPDECVHQLRQPVDGTYQSAHVIGVDGQLSPVVLPEAVLVVRELFGR